MTEDFRGSGPSVVALLDDEMTQLKDICSSNGDHDICAACEQVGLLERARAEIERLWTLHYQAQKVIDAAATFSDALNSSQFQQAMGVYNALKDKR